MLSGPVYLLRAASLPVQVCSRPPVLMPNRSQVILVVVFTFFLSLVLLACGDISLFQVSVVNIREHGKEID